MTGPHFTVRETEMLELLRKLRPFTNRADMGSDPRLLTLQSMHKAIDDVAEAITGKRDYFWAKLHSIGGG